MLRKKTVHVRTYTRKRNGTIERVKEHYRRPPCR